jgi:UDP-N-acetylmuramate dehydrogenase
MRTMALRRNSYVEGKMAPGILSSGNGLRGTMRSNEPMAKHVSWRAGGVAERVYVPADLADLARFVRSRPEGEALVMVGLGSNLLVRDGGVRGTVVLLHGALGRLSIEQRRNGIGVVNGSQVHDYALIYAEAGVASPKVARFAARHNLVGAEFLAGIPGTVGGALAMNAGCYGAETWDIVTQVLTLDHKGNLTERPMQEYQIGYRRAELKTGAQEWFVAAWLKLPNGDGEESRHKIKELLKKRIASQPLNLPNAGSVFRNPPDDFAARLIEACGLKGTHIGGAMVSPKHANFIVNTGGATAADIEALIETVEEVVLRRQGVALEREVRIIGNTK